MTWLYVFWTIPVLVAAAPWYVATALMDAQRPWTRSRRCVGSISAACFFVTMLVGALVVYA